MRKHKTTGGVERLLIPGVLGLAFAIAPMTGCEETEMEEAGEQMEEAGEETGEWVDETAEDTEDAIDDTVDDIEDDG